MRRMRIGALLLALVLLLCAGCREDKPDSDTGSDNVQGQDSDTDWENTVSYNGTTYRRRTDLKTVLFLGVDNTQTVEAEGIMVGNSGRADAIMLFILDTAKETTQILNISRDTMTEVDAYKGNGDLAYSGVMHLNMQYSFGDSPRRCNFLMKRTVSELLYNTKIDACFSLTMDGFREVVDEMGGITLTMPEDYTEIDPRYTAGAEVHMDGADAERFARYRDLTEHGSNEDRVERQSWFVHSLFQQMRAQENKGETLDELLEMMDPYMETDLDAETMEELTRYTLLDGALKVPGTAEAGEAHDEFYVDEEALQELIIQLFYEPV